MKINSISAIIIDILLFWVGHISTLPISKLCYLTDITSGPSRVITSGECGLKCGSKAGCLTFIICDIAFSKTCTIYKLASKETCGKEGVKCSYFIQNTVSSDSGEITKSLRLSEQDMIVSPVTKTTTTITKTITTTSVVTSSFPATSPKIETESETSSHATSSTADYTETTTEVDESTSDETTERTKGTTILSQTLGLNLSTKIPRNESAITDTSTSTTSESMTTEVPATTKIMNCPDHLPKEICQPLT
ncbi:location of vulva defective 1-like [Saccostrea cucullata]|uniref:location of vulva defective 1-like n=1 Tax=Saccostrea cuccullata TaxID=36930 RepID=UPI002ED1853D